MNRETLRSIVSKATIGIAGAGGLGSNCAASLVRSGVRRLIIADFDRVSEANLDRQFFFFDQIGRLKVDALAENLRRIDPKINIETHPIRLDADSIRTIFADCDIIVEAFDNAESKAIIAETVLTAFPEKHLVSASGLAGIGNLEDIHVVHRGKLHLCGDFTREVGPESPPIAPRVAIVANFEADIVLQLLIEWAQQKAEL